MAANASRRKLVNAKATTKYLEAFFDATRIQSEANALDRDVAHAIEQQVQLERERFNWEQSKPAKRQRTLTDSATGMLSTRRNSSHTLRSTRDHHLGCVIAAPRTWLS